MTGKERRPCEDKEQAGNPAAQDQVGQPTGFLCPRSLDPVLTQIELALGTPVRALIGQTMTLGTADGLGVVGVDFFVGMNGEVAAHLNVMVALDLLRGPSFLESLCSGGDSGLPPFPWTPV